MARIVSAASDGMREVGYKCSNPKCLATDKVRYFPNEQVLPVINCWKCHAGFQKTTADQLAFQVGMFPLLEAV